MGVGSSKLKHPFLVVHKLEVRIIEMVGDTLLQLLDELLLREALDSLRYEGLIMAESIDNTMDEVETVLPTFRQIIV